MPRYFFDYIGPDASMDDDVGLDLPFEPDARAEAFKLLPIDVADAPPGDNEFRSWSVTIRDAIGTRVARIVMTVLVEAGDGGGDTKLFRPS